jgi:hypothetical protein
MLVAKITAMSWRGWLLLTITLAGMSGLALHGPIQQGVGYHDFADQTSVLGVPNFWNVASNLPFLLIGLYGLALLRRGHCGGAVAHLRPAYYAFFAAICLVGLGSTYYHLTPSDATLVWDRAPMTVAFMAFFSAILSQHVNSAFVERALVPLVVFGLCSVGLWQISGDLRPYVLVQYLPVLLIPAIVILYPSKLATHFVWPLLAAYMVAKAFEHFDHAVYHVLNVSGHSLKHVAAALGIYFVVRGIKSWPVNEMPSASLIRLCDGEPRFTSNASPGMPDHREF